MKRIAIISPMILPVPAIKGGAVEGLITKLIQGNEEKKQLHIDLFTVAEEGLEKYSYSFTDIHQISQGIIERKLEQVLDKIKRTFQRGGIKRLIDKKVVARVLELDYDAIVVENMSGIYSLLRKRVTCPIYFHIHNPLDLYRTTEDIQLIEKSGDCVIAIGNYMKDQVEKNVPGIRCNILMNCISLSRFSRVVPEIREKWREKYGITKGQIVFLYAGRIIREKGVLELLDAFSEVRKRTPQAVLLIAGTAMFEKQNKKMKYQAEVKNKIQQMEGVIPTGFIEADNMPYIYSIADVGVIPSIWNEPFGMVTLEMMASELPLIVTNRGELPFIVDDKCASIVETEGNFVEQLTQNMMQLTEDSEKRQKMGKAAKLRLLENPNFNDINYYDRFVEILTKHRET